MADNKAEQTKMPDNTEQTKMPLVYTIFFEHLMEWYQARPERLDHAALLGCNAKNDTLARRPIAVPHLMWYVELLSRLLMDDRLKLTRECVDVNAPYFRIELRMV
jgi:hypothetical protein